MGLTRILRVLAFLAICAGVGHAQVYMIQQTVQQTLGTNQACTGAPQIITGINNLGQTQHYLQISGLTNTTQFQAVIQGKDAQGNVYNISDVMEPKPGVSETVRGSGYYPRIQVSITCFPAVTGTFTASYSGSQFTDDGDFGSYLLAQIDKNNFTGVAENANQSDVMQSPFGSSAGTLNLFTTAGESNAFIQITCIGAEFSNLIATFTIANNTSPQTFHVPDWPCPNVQVSYVNGGGAGTLTTEFVFSQPGSSHPSYTYTHVTGTTATSAKAVTGFLHTIAVNTGASGTISVFDLAVANCTGTPSTNTVAVITATATTLQTFTYDSNFANGICVKASAGMDFTVSAQ